MLRRRLTRLSTSFFLLLSLLFSQLALAAYVCPGQDDVAMAEMMTAGMPCEGMDLAQPLLCHEHSASAAQSSDAAKLPTPTLPMLVQVLVVPLQIESSSAAGLTHGRKPQARPPPDPLFLSTLRLRV